VTNFQSVDSVAEIVPETARSGRRLAGVFLFALAAQFMIVIMFGAAMAPDYNFNEAAISDLGVIGATATMFNASLIVVGAFNLIGGYYFYRSHGKRWLLGIFALAGIGAMGAGIFPLEPEGIHGLFALLAFLFFNVQAIGSATRVAGVMKALSILAGLVGLAFLVVMALGDGGNEALFGPIGHGGVERMIVYPPMLWMMAFGGYLLGTSSDTRVPAVGEPTESAD
jgi:hypothetical membrane protein